MKLTANDLKHISKHLMVGASEKFWCKLSNGEKWLIKYNGNYSLNFAEMLYSYLSKRVGFNSEEAEFINIGYRYDQLLILMESMEKFQDRKLISEDCKKIDEDFVFDIMLTMIESDKTEEGVAVKSYMTQDVVKEYSADKILDYVQSHNKKLGYYHVKKIDNFNRATLENVEFLARVVKKFCQNRNYKINYEKVKTELVKLIIFDWFVFQRDRHDENLSFLKLINNEIVFAPAFDNAYADILYGRFLTLLTQKEKNIMLKSLIKRRKKLSYKIFQNNEFPPTYIDSTPLDKNYAVGLDKMSYKKIYYLASHNKEVKQFILNMLQVDLNQVVMELNKLAKSEGCKKYHNGNISISCEMFKYKQKGVKEMFKLKALEENKKLTPEKLATKQNTLFKLQNKTLNKLCEKRTLSVKKQCVKEKIQI